MSEVDARRPTGRTVQQPEIEGVDTDTRPMWAIAVLPLVGVLIGLIPASFNGFAPDGTPTGIALNVLAIVLSAGLWVSALLLAVADRRVLRQRGIIRPMHPAWELLDPVYVIGRSVVVRRRVRGSLNPLWVWIGTTVVAYALNSIPR